MHLVDKSFCSYFSCVDRPKHVLHIETYKSLSICHVNTITASIYNTTLDAKGY
jgi:hypothetical protein